MFQNRARGFTLLEILLVVGIIAILAGIVIVAINPARQLAQVRNTERRSDIKQIDSAVKQFYIDKGYYPASTTLTTSLTEICATGDNTATVDCDTDNLVDLSELVPTYITSIPVDPKATTVNGSGYSILKDSSRKTAVKADNAELDTFIAIGISGPTGGGGGGTTTCDASGGEESEVGGYKIHTFTSDGTFTVNSDNCTVEVLVVAGGGGGGMDGGGAGGAGGLAYSSNLSISGEFNVNIGQAGQGANSSSENGGQGGDSSFGDIFSVSGGGGGKSRYGGDTGINGGSGGGGSWNNYDPGAGTSGQGFAGGSAATGGNYGTGGGGGAGGVGSSGSGYHGGSGGVGKNYPQFATVGGSPAGWFAGGGGGGNGQAEEEHINSGLGGNGGGGDGSACPGSYSRSGTDGIPNTGGGAGGNCFNGGILGHDGGSGIVIVRYSI